jgi:hypothetical protein
MEPTNRASSDVRDARELLLRLSLAISWVVRQIRLRTG